MTTPKLDTFTRNGTRYYVHPTRPISAPGVTSVLDTLPKGWLGPYQMKQAATVAVRDAKTIEKIIKSDEENGERKAVEHVRKAANAERDTAAAFGNDVHYAIECFIRNEPIPWLAPQQRLCFEHFLNWVELAQPEFFACEETGWYESADGVFVYSGTYDIGAVVERTRWLIDAKTTKSGVHEEVTLQLNAYANFQEIISADGSSKPMHDIEALGVLHLRPEGAKFKPVEFSPAMFEMFEHLYRSSFRWDREGVKKGTVGKDLLPAMRKRRATESAT